MIQTDKGTKATFIKVIYKSKHIILFIYYTNTKSLVLEIVKKNSR